MPPASNSQDRPVPACVKSGRVSGTRYKPDPWREGSVGDAGHEIAAPIRNPTASSDRVVGARLGKNISLLKNIAIEIHISDARYLILNATALSRQSALLVPLFRGRLTMYGGDVGKGAARDIPIFLHEQPFEDALQAARNAIERRLIEVTRSRRTGPAASSQLDDAIRYAVLGGGKRLRAILVLLTNDMLGGNVERALHAAAAVECVHAQSLVHDDLPCMDDDDLRRGKPSVHRKFDEATAVLCGDALLTLAFELLADERTHLDPSCRLRLIAELARSVGRDGLALGQTLDLKASMAWSADEMLHCAELKTARLFEFSLLVGAIVAGARHEQLASLVKFGTVLGLAFQVSDDLLDRLGDEKQIGKRLNKDAVSGRRTATEIWGIEGAREKLHQLASDGRSQLACFGEPACHIRELIDVVVGRVP